MNLTGGLHLAYCTNIHRGESWGETMANLERYTLAVRSAVCPKEEYAIGLRLSEQAARELSDPPVLKAFRTWLQDNDCYVFTINGFPYGRFHGTRVKEQVYRPDWTNSARLEYTKLLFDILAQLVPDGVEGSVSTVPGSFKEFITSPEQERAMRDQVWACVEYVAALSKKCRRGLHLGLEPEPLCYLETSAETVRFFEQLRSEHPGDGRINDHLGVNYDTCHLAVEFEEPHDVLARFRSNGIRVSKLHLSSALKVRPTPEVRKSLAAFCDSVYFHQVISKDAEGKLHRYPDLDVALATAASDGSSSEWRIHFHIPLHSRPAAFFDSSTSRHQMDFMSELSQSSFDNTTDHLCGALDVLGREPGLCSHLEMETYTWEVLPPELKKREVVDQLIAEYGWTLDQLAKRGLRPIGI